MDKWTEARRSLQMMETPGEESLYRKIHPLAKFLTTILFLVLVTSCARDHLDVVLAMGVWLYAYALIGGLSAGQCFRKMWGLFALLFFVGIANPILDRVPALTVGHVVISRGMIAFVSLFLKGALALLSAYFLAVTTGMNGILSALLKLKVPVLLINVIYLIYRYLGLMIQEASDVWTAYRLRAPGQKGIHFSVWGSLVGSMMIRSMDKAEKVYQSMELRGYKPEETFAGEEKWNKESTVYLLICLLSLCLFRFLPIFSLIGSIFMGR
ncbi:MAG: hypothetical protein IJM83_00790 [Firmicutes bacterium]|nr:hypothetical protein [Bacillota bacterium]